MERFAPGYDAATIKPAGYNAAHSSSSSSSSSSDSEAEHPPARAAPPQSWAAQVKNSSDSSEDSDESAEEDAQEYTAPKQATDTSSSSESEEPAPRARAAASRAKPVIPDEFLRRSGRDRKQVETLNVDHEPSRRRSKYAESSEDDEDSDSEADYGGSRRAKRRAPARKKAAPKAAGGGARRTTGRAKATVNYADDDDGNSDDEAYERIQNAKKRQAILATDNPDVELEEGDIIENVIEHRWFQEDNGDGILNISPDGTRGEETLGLETKDEGGGHLKFQVKWKGWSHFHNTWGSRKYLSEFKGYNRVANYLKKWDEHVEQYEEWPAEEQEAYDLEREMSLDLLRSHVQVQRVVAQRRAVREGAGEIEYLTKWEGLTYDEATWEGVEDLDQIWQVRWPRHHCHEHVITVLITSSLS